MRISCSHLQESFEFLELPLFDFGAGKFPINYKKFDLNFPLLDGFGEQGGGVRGNLPLLNQQVKISPPVKIKLKITLYQNPYSEKTLVPS